MHINILLACCRNTVLFQANLNYLQGLQVCLLHSLPFCFFSLQDAPKLGLQFSSYACFWSWVQLQVLGGGFLVGRLVGG